MKGHSTGKGAERFNFTQAALRSIEPPADGRRAVWDSKVRALQLVTTAAGARTFYLYRWIDGRPQRVRLGSFEDLTVDQARSLAEQCNGEIAKGEGLSLRQRRSDRGLTLGSTWEDWYVKHAEPTKRTAAYDLWQWKTHLEPWKHKALADITRGDVAAWHRGIGKKNGPYAANRALALLRTLFNHADTMLGYEGGHPTRKVARFKEAKRARFVEAAEFPLFMQALKDEPDECFRNIVVMLLVTGARKGAVLSMRWLDVDPVRRVWTIPPGASKNGLAIQVPLLSFALAVLQERRLAVPESSLWVFPSARASSGHVEVIKKPWAKLLKRAGLKNLRMHDLRRTMGSWQSMSGSNSQIVGRTLGHEDPRATAVYARLDLEPVRVGMANAVDAMLARSGSAASALPMLDVKGCKEETKAATDPPEADPARGNGTSKRMR